MRFLITLSLLFISFAPALAQSETAHAKNAAPRLPLAEAATLANVPNADPLASGNVPNYLLAVAQHTKAAPQYANLVQTVIFGGTVAPATKVAMAAKIAQIYDSAYLTAHAQRWARAVAPKQVTLSDTDKLALEYAEKLTRDIHGVSDADFARVRGSFNDAQIVELTMTVCFFNHFVRVAEALNLPVETWVINDKAPKLPANLPAFATPKARITLASDAEMNAASTAVNAAKEQAKAPTGLGLGIANSQRAMLRVPDIAQAWRDFGFQNRQSWTIERNIQLQISFAVSMANGCRYCTLHQVLGLRRLGVDINKLLAMKKDDSALTPRELVAVQFARKLTTAPRTVTDADFAKVKAEFGEQGAMEVVLQTGAFAFMNRFTDGLRLPSEDEAIKVYQETYGDGTYRTDWQRK